jgi:anti-anti-sigma factor
MGQRCGCGARLGKNNDMSGMSGLVQVVDRQEGSVLVCEIRGELDASNVDQVLENVVDRVANDAPGVVLDLTRTTYLDSAGVRILFELSRRLRARRQELRIAVPHDGIVRRVLVLTALGDVVPLDDDVHKGVNALGAQT